MINYIKVSIPIVLYKTFIYSYNKKLKNIFIGQAVKVNFNNREVLGFVIDINDSTNYKLKIKPIISPFKNSIPLKQELLKTINWVSKYYLCPIGKTLKATVPYQLYPEFTMRKIKEIKISDLSKQDIENVIYPKQKLILKFLKTHDAFINISELKPLSNAYMSICAKLLKKNLITIRELRDTKLLKQNKKKQINLNHEQLKIYNKIKNDTTNNISQFIVSGLPGSGKTEIYIKIIKNIIIQSNKDSIVLVPEISLIPQTYDRINNIFPNQVGVWHCKQTKKDKQVVLNKIKKNEIKIMVGARSCLFVPFNNLGFIVVDEEHETSYKQTGASPFYHARDVAIMRCKLSNSMLVLCSATPSLETYYNKINNNFQYYYLNHRYKNMQMPKISKIDMINERYSHRKNPIISKFLKIKIDETLLKGEQIVLLQNRRGFAYIIKCCSCNMVMQCPNCCVSLKYHQNQNVLKCHHCNYTNRAITYCKHCNSNSIKFYGVGTQKLESVLYKLYPDVKILRYDQDSIKSNYAEILSQFENGFAEILIGTQAVAKGLDFKKVSLVGVINADLGMFIPDFRSGEKTFQLIYQLIGRSGRHIINSHAIIQTYNIDDQYINFACKGSINNFYEKAIKEREALFYPPYSRLIRIIVEGESKLVINKKIKFIYNKLVQLNLLKIIGPTKPPIEKINNKFRLHLIIKSHKNDWIKIYDFITKSVGLETFEKKSLSYNIKIDVDPQTFL